MSVAENEYVGADIMRLVLAINRPFAFLIHFVNVFAKKVEFSIC